MATTTSNPTATADRPGDRADRRQPASSPGARSSATWSPLLTWVLVFLFFFPVLWMLITSFKTEAAAAAVPAPFFFDATLDRYAAVFRARHGPLPAELVVRLRAAPPWW